MYDSVTLADYSVSLWDSMKFEILNAQEEELAEETLRVVCSIIQRSNDVERGDTSKASLSGFSKLVAKECVDRLKEPQHKQGKAAARILSAIAAISPGMYQEVTRTTLPNIVSQYQGSQNVEERTALLEALSRIIGAPPSQGQDEFQSSSSTSVLGPSSDLLGISIRMLSDNDDNATALKLEATKCLSLMCGIPNALEPSEIAVAAQQFNTILMKPFRNIDSDWRDAAVQGLRAVAKLNPNYIVDKTFPSLLPLVLKSGRTFDFENYCVNLECLANISLGEPYSGTLVRRLFGRIHDIIKEQERFEEAQALMSTINYILIKERESATSRTKAESYYQGVSDLLAIVANVALGARPPGPLNHPSVLLALGRLTLTVFQSLDGEEQGQCENEVYTLFSDSHTPIILGQPPDQELLEQRRNTIVLSTFLLAALKNAPNTIDTWKALLVELVQLSLAENAPFAEQGLAQHISLVVNKFFPADHLEAAALILYQLVDRSSETPTASVWTSFSIARALIWRNYEIEPIIDQLLRTVGSPAGGWEAARGFDLLFGPDEVLTRKNGAVIRQLWKQRAFSICLPAIATAVRGSQPKTKGNYLNALCNMIKYIGTSMLLPEMGTVTPLLLQALDLDEGDGKDATIRVLMTVIQEDPVVLEEYISSLVNRLLKVVANSRDNNAVKQPLMLTRSVLTRLLGRQDERPGPSQAATGQDEGYYGSAAAPYRRQRRDGGLGRSATTSQASSS